MGDKFESAWKKFTPAGMIVEALKPPEMPEPPALPAPVEDVDAQSQRDFTKRKLKSRKGRQSTILASKNQSKKTVLG